MRSPFAPLAVLAFASLPLLAPACSSDSSEGESAEPSPTVSPSSSVKPDEKPTGPCGEGLSTDPEPVPKIHTPRWAFEPWISKDISTTDDTYAFVGGFEERGIPVGVVVLDSPWETNYHTFEPNPVRYHDFDKLIADLKAKNIRVVLWMTSQINVTSFDAETGGDLYSAPSPNYDEADSCGFFVNGGQTWTWWKGKGSSIDFFNPRAMAWWHWQQNRVLDAGVAGFKLDFGESYITAKELDTAGGKVSHQDYSEAYYRDFYAHGVKRNGPEEFVTMVRPYDKSYFFEGRFFARKEHAPVNWVGDNRRDWVGVDDALDEIFISARAGYVVVGSDIGGYLDRDDQDLTKTIPPCPECFLRWTAWGAMTPFMQLHGRANLTPWTYEGYEEKAVAAWKYWATLHHQLVPFFYGLAEEAYAGAEPIIRPVGEPESWKGDYRFHVGEAFLVAPLLAEGNKRDVALPEGARYYDWFHPESAPLDGGQTLKDVDASDWTRVPVYVREGAIIPLDDASDVTSLGDASSKGALTLLVYPGPQPSRFVLHDEDGKTTTIEASSGGSAATVKLSRATRPVLLRVRAEQGAKAVSVDGAPLTEAPSSDALAQAGSGFRQEAASKSVWIRLPSGDAARTVTVTF